MQNQKDYFTHYRYRIKILFEERFYNASMNYNTNKPYGWMQCFYISKTGDTKSASDEYKYLERFIQKIIKGTKTFDTHRFYNRHDINVYKDGEVYTGEMTIRELFLNDYSKEGTDKCVKHYTKEDIEELRAKKEVVATAPIKKVSNGVYTPPSDYRLSKPIHGNSEQQSIQAATSSQPQQYSMLDRIRAAVNKLSAYNGYFHNLKIKEYDQGNDQLVFEAESKEAVEHLTQKRFMHLLRCKIEDTTGSIKTKISILHSEETVVMDSPTHAPSVKINPVQSIMNNPNFQSKR